MNILIYVRFSDLKDVVDRGLSRFLSPGKIFPTLAQKSVCISLSRDMGQNWSEGTTEEKFLVRPPSPVISE